MVFRDCDVHVTTLQLHVRFADVGADINEDTELTDPYLVSELFKAVGAFLGNKENALGAEDENALQDVATTEPTNLSAVNPMVAVNFNTVTHLLEDAVVEMTSKHRVHCCLATHWLVMNDAMHVVCSGVTMGVGRGRQGGPWPPGFWND